MVCISGKRLAIATFLLLLIALSCPLATWAQVKIVPADAGSDSWHVSISGRVVDERGHPLRDVIVYLRETPSMRDTRLPTFGGLYWREQRQYWIEETTTDAEGQFAFEIKLLTTDRRQSEIGNPLEWCLVASAPGRSLAWCKLDVAHFDGPILLTVEPGTSISGTVRDSRGQPLPDVGVYVDEISDLGRRRYEAVNSLQQFVFRNSVLSPRAVTDALGKFTIENLPLNRRFCLVTSSETFATELAYVATTAEVQPDVEQRVRYGGERQTLRFPVHLGTASFELVPGNQLKGQLVYEDGEPARQQDVTVELRPSGLKLRLQTDNEGHFATNRFRDSLARVWVARPQREEYVTADWLVDFERGDRQETERLEIPIAKILRGRLVDDQSQPVPGARIIFAPTPVAPFVFDRQAPEALTNEDGEFEIRTSNDTGVLFAVGPLFGYELCSSVDAKDFQFGKLEKLPSTAMQVKRTDQSETDARLPDLRCQAARVMTGVVVDSEGQRVPGATVDILDGVFEWNGPFGGMARDDVRALFTQVTDESGRFRISGIPRVENVVFSVNSSDRSEVALVYVDSLKSLTDVGVQLEPAVTVTGRATLDGAPATDVAVSINTIGDYKIDSRGQSLREQFHWGMTRTDMAGEFKFRGLPPKPEYFLSARIGTRWDLSHNPRRDHGDLTVEVPDFDFVTMDAEVHGIVVTPQGDPVSGVEMGVSGINHGRFFTTRDIIGNQNVTGADGRFVLRELPRNTPLTISARLSRDQRTEGDSSVPARVDVMAGDKDVRVIFDPRLGQSPRKHKE